MGVPGGDVCGNDGRRGVYHSESTPQYRLDPSFPLEIEREHLVKQTLEIIKKANPKDIRKRLRVSFKGEPGLDAGGVTKEVSAQSSTVDHGA